MAAASTRRHSHHPIRARRKEMFGGMAPKRITMFNDVVPQRKAQRKREKGREKKGIRRRKQIIIRLTTYN